MGPLKKDIKWVRTLHQKKFRNESGYFLVEGKKMVEEALRSEYEVQQVLSTDTAFVAQVKNAILVSSKEMEQMSALTTPSDFLAVLKQKNLELTSPSGKTVLILDGIADPGNMGTMIRTAEWFGIHDVYCTNDSVELYNPKVVQSTMGSLFRVNVQFGSASEIADVLRKQNFKLIGADLGKASVFEMDFPENVALVIGSESHGIRTEMKSQLDESVSIPGDGKAESLNASVAAAILMAELFRRRR